MGKMTEQKKFEVCTCYNNLESHIQKFIFLLICPPPPTIPLPGAANALPGPRQARRPMWRTLIISLIINSQIKKVSELMSCITIDKEVSKRVDAEL